MECCRCTHAECPAWERINLITVSFLGTVISAIRLDRGLAQRLACSELIMQSRAPNYCKVTEIEQISTAKIVKVPGSRISATPSKVECKSFVFCTAGARDFHLNWWAEGPCDTRKFLPRSACGDHSPERPKAMAPA